MLWNVKIICWYNNLIVEHITVFDRERIRILFNSDCRALSASCFILILRQSCGLYINVKLTYVSCRYIYLHKDEFLIHKYQEKLDNINLLTHVAMIRGNHAWILCRNNVFWQCHFLLKIRIRFWKTVSVVGFISKSLNFFPGKLCVCMFKEMKVVFEYNSRSYIIFEIIGFTCQIRFICQIHWSVWGVILSQVTKFISDRFRSNYICNTR